MKVCTKCGEAKEEEDFGFRDIKKVARRGRCRPCERQRGNDRINANRRYVRSYLESHPCIDCGNPDIRVLEFDHVRGNKVRSVSDMIFKRNSVTTIQREIDKCEVRCANCHRIVTFTRGGSYRLTNV